MKRIWITSALVVLVTLPSHSQTSQPPDTQNTQHGRVRGTVVNDEGEPVAQVMLCTRIANPKGEMTSCGSARTDENGAFEISQLPLTKIDVYAQASIQGYGAADQTARAQTVTLTSNAPIAHIALKVGSKPGALILNVTDKTTGKAVDTFFVRLIGETAGYCSGTGNFDRVTPSSVRVPVSSRTEEMVEVSAPGYKNWFYSDASDPSRPVLRLESGEERSLEVLLEPK